MTIIIVNHRLYRWLFIFNHFMVKIYQHYPAFSIQMKCHFILFTLSFILLLYPLSFECQNKRYQKWHQYRQYYSAENSDNGIRFS